MDRATFLQLIISHFNLEEIRELCFELELDYESLAGEGKAAKVRELISLLQRIDRLPDFVSLLNQKRPKVPWPEAGDVGKSSYQRDSPLQRIMLSKLPTTDHQTLFGRVHELQTLDNAWLDPSRSIIIFMAWGGVGKTALINHWLSHMALRNYDNAGRVYGWSFYSQGSIEASRASADEFLVHALRWFGDPEPNLGTPWEKGVRLADLIRAQPTLLILDGLEPLQHASGPMQGHLKDHGLKALLKELSASNQGLCVVSTRVKIWDLASSEGATVQTVALENLSLDASSRLLQSLGVLGSRDELELAAEEYDRHALALILLGSYLTVVHGGQIQKIVEIPDLAFEEKHGGHARRILESYERWLADTANSELSILKLLGLFDRPVRIDLLKELCSTPTIPELTSDLQQLSDRQWRYALEYLRNLRLIAEKDSSNPDLIDCHPLIREHFGNKIYQLFPHSCRIANIRLFNYYKNQPTEYCPSTLEELEPLVLAVYHGCKAGLFEETLNEVYYPRILRGPKGFYITGKLGAFGSQLSILSNYFETPWESVVSSLSRQDQAFIIHQTGYCLRALGRPSDAIRLISDVLELYKQLQDWNNATMASSHVSRILQDTGNIRGAIEAAEKGVLFADKAEDIFQQIDSRTVLAYSLTSAGRLVDAEHFLLEAEQIQAAYEVETPLLYGLPGWRYCDVLLARGEDQLVLSRGQLGLEKATSEADLLSIGAYHLAIALAKSHQLDVGSVSTEPRTVLVEFGHAVEGFRTASRKDFLPRALIPRAHLQISFGQYSDALDDLVEAHQIMVYDDLNLFRTDVHLECVYLCTVLLQSEERFQANIDRTNDRLFAVSLTTTTSQQDLLEEAYRHLGIARQLINDTGYMRYRPALLLLHAELALFAMSWAEAQDLLAEAKKIIDETSSYVWMSTLKRLEAKL